jgi:LacI family repressor for deo operon, udp, cdd, tsx, nupC, and nupG
LAEVAKHVGVSQATVSRVLNGKPGISEATRAAVLTALDVLGYERPTKLRGERARLVGLVLPDLHNPIFPALAEVMAGALAKRGMTPVLCAQTVEDVSETEYVRILLEQHVSGVIFAGGDYQNATAKHEQYAQLRERSLPTVLINAAVDELSFPRVSTDDAHAVDQAYSHLAALGHKQIGLILGATGNMPSARKFAAYRALHGSSELVAHAGNSVEESQAATTRLIRAGATALICASDNLALGAIRAARRRGLEIPRDLSVIGFDDSAMMTFTDPPLTTVRQPIAAMGQAAVTLLVSQIDSGRVPNDELLFEPELVVRSSTGAVPR